MAKTNFSKGENILQEIMDKLMREKLLDIATTETGGTIDTKLRERIYLIFEIQLELKRLHRSDRKIYRKLGVRRKDLDQLMSDPTKVTEEQWALLTKLKEKVDEHLKELLTTTNDELVEKERRKHITKRLNVNEKWLPLDLG